MGSAKTPEEFLSLHYIAYQIWEEMPLIIVTGHPCSGKSTFSLRLREYLEGKGCAVVMVNEESEKISRDVGYADSGREKTTRGVLKSAIDHNLNDRTYVIADSLNYIKGTVMSCTAWPAPKIPSTVVFWCNATKRCLNNGMRGRRSSMEKYTMQRSWLT